MNAQLNHLNHKHCIIKANYSKEPQNEMQLDRFLEILVDKINMNIFMGPWTKYCGTSGNEGYTTTVIIETSHAVLHLWRKSEWCQQAYLQFDLYSCADFDTNIIKSLLVKEFEATDFQIITLDRNNKLEILEDNKQHLKNVGPNYLIFS